MPILDMVKLKEDLKSLLKIGRFGVNCREEIEEYIEALDEEQIKEWLKNGDQVKEFEEVVQTSKRGADTDEARYHARGRVWTSQVECQLDEVFATFIARKRQERIPRV